MSVVKRPGGGKVEPHRGFTGVLVTLYSLLQLLKTRGPRLPRLPRDHRTEAGGNEQRSEVRSTSETKH